MWHYKDKYSDRASIYLMHSKHSGYWKIGMSIDPERRVKQLRWYVPDLQLVDFVRAHPCWEGELHGRYASCRVFGEWFTLNEQQVQVLRELFKAKRDWDEEQCTKAAAGHGSNSTAVNG